MSERRTPLKVFVILGFAAVVSASMSLFVLWYRKITADRSPGTTTIVTEYEGRKIKLELPKMELNTPEEIEKFQAVVMQEMQKNPEFIKANEAGFEAWKEMNKNNALKRLDEDEQRYLDQIPHLHGSEEEKHWAEKQTKESFKTARKQVLEHIESATMQ